ncbi:MAG: type VI secretion system Vgr family protein [Pirellulaceae bacterium]
MALSQATRHIKISTPLGEDVLLLTAFAGREEMSRLFHFHLDLISDRADIEAKEIVGKNVTFSVERADGSVRYFNGFVSRFAAGDEEDGRRNYRAEVVPWLWFLTRTADCRIFQQMKVGDIVQQIFSELGFTDFDVSLQLPHKQWEYCVQYRETDFNFVSRLMEQEGMFYYFRHENGKHTLVLSDHKGSYGECPEGQVDFPPTVGQMQITDHITRWEHQYEFCTGKWAQTDYNFETPSTSLLTKTGSVVQLPGIDKFEYFDFPGEYRQKSEGEAETKVRMEEIESAFDVVTGQSACKTFAPGCQFKVGVHRSATEEGKTFVLTSVAHQAREAMAYETGPRPTSGPDYANSFTCIPAAVVFRPARITPKPVVSGLQTAIIVGPAGEEIYVDKYGRVKVQFHWDRLGQKDENSSCWIRVSQTNAEKGFGAMHIPRVGTEVIVSFLEGDPDQPLIVGRVYHAENMPPYGLPDSKSISGIKSKTYKGGGYNEMIMDDSPGKELVRIHAQKNMSTKVLHDQDLTVVNDRTVTVTGKLTESITKDTKITIVSGTYTHSVAANSASYTVKGNIDEAYLSNQTTKVAGQIHIDSGKDILISAKDKITLVVGQSQLQMDSAGNIALAGVSVKIIGSDLVHCDGGKLLATGKTEAKLGVGNQNVACDPAKVAVSGAAINASAVGVHEITGALVKIN